MMLKLKLLALLCVGTVANAASNVCTAPSYAALAPLALLPAVQSFCSSSYPVPPVTSTSISRVTTTSTSTLTSTVLKTTTTTTTTTAITSTTTTAPTAVTITDTVTSTRTVTLAVAAAKRFMQKRQVYADAKRALLDPISSILALPGAGASTYCSCNEVPKTTTTTVTSTSTVPTSTTRTVTNTITATSTATTTATSTITSTRTSTTTTTTTTTVTATPPVSCSQTTNPYTTNGKTFDIHCGSVYTNVAASDQETTSNVADLKTCIDICAARTGCIAVNYDRPDSTCSTFLAFGSLVTDNYDVFDAAGLQGST